MVQVELGRVNNKVMLCTTKNAYFVPALYDGSDQLEHREANLAPNGCKNHSLQLFLLCEVSSIPMELAALL